MNEKPDFYPCPLCGATIDNSKPFIQCARTDCPEKTGKSLLELLQEQAAAKAATARIPLK